MRVAVIGAGVIGASAAKVLKDRGVEVTLFDCDPIMQARSAGDWMLFRIAHRSPELVVAARDALLLYEDWQRDAGTEMLHRESAVLTGRGWALKEWADAMEAGRAAYEYRESPIHLNLPVKDFDLPSLIDPAGGVLDVAQVRRYLRRSLQDNFRQSPVLVLRPRALNVIVTTPEGDQEFDAAIVTAGEQTNEVLAGTGLSIPSRLSHHFRFTFPMKDPRKTYSSWISRINGMITYQYPSAPGEWTIGAHLPDEHVNLRLHRQEAEKRVKQALKAYVSENLEQISPKVLRVMYGTVHSDITDGYEILQEGHITTTYGDNLFKLAPHLGLRLAATALGEQEPVSLILTPPE